MSKQLSLAGETATRLVNQHETDNYDIDIGRADGGESHINNTRVGEPGWLGNPYALSKGFSRDESIRRYRVDFAERLCESGRFRAAVEGLRGQTLGCWCAPERCHGDVILAYLAETDEPQQEPPGV